MYALPDIFKFHLSLYSGHETSLVFNSVFEPSKLSSGALNFAVYFILDSRFNKTDSKSSNPSKNSSTTLLFGLIKKLSSYVYAPPNGDPFTVRLTNPLKLTSL